MKKTPYFLLVALTLFCFCNCGNKTVTSKSLEAGFINPPDSIQTSVYWYWISDHLSEEGVVKDLQSMKEAGINRAFIGNIGLSEGESGRGKVQFNTEEWWKVLHKALKTATELNIEIGIFNSPGWSQSGGPWVKPEEAMRYLASSRTPVEGGKKIDITLEKPQGDFQDVKVLAYPDVSKKGTVLSARNGRVSSTPNISGVNNIIDGDKNTEITFPENVKEVTFNFTANEPLTLRNLKIYITHNRFHSPAKLEVKKDGAYTTLSEFAISRYNPAANVGFDPYAPIMISVPETTATEFRLTISGLRPNSGIKDVELSSLPGIERYPEKTLARMFQDPLPYWHEYQWKDQPEVSDESLYIKPSDVIDITEHLKGDQLTWDAPAGDWIVMRSGMVPTGTQNSPASPEATGFEIDKMSKKHAEAHFEAYMGEIIRRIPAEDRKTWKVVVQDSYETGGQNFTDTFLEDFKQRYGYDALPFLPVYNGVVIQSEDASNRFLWDMRRLVADKVAYDYVAGLREISHKYGLRTWLENYGHWGFPGEFLQYGGQSDEIGGEFWSEGSLGDIENRAASSCGHIYGKTKISAESFTAAGGAFHRYPAQMKPRGDRFFSEGINNTLLHVYISQPYEDKEPGVNAWFGNEFNRKNTWFSQMDLFTSYLKRTNFMLQQGLNVADVAYFIGEDAPKMTGITDPALPRGYQFDYINAEVIEKYMTVKDGLLTLPHGTQYRILVLPKLETMRPELLAKIKQLIEGGGVVLGPAPKRSPSFENYPKADEEVKSMANELWSKVDAGTKYAKIGQGTLIDGMNMEEAFALINCVPDCKTNADEPVLYNHRTINGMEVYFITNQSDKKIATNPELRVKGMQPELWDATNGSIRKLPAFSETATGTIVPLKLDAYESVFIVFRDKVSAAPASSSADINFPEPQIMADLNSGWSLTFDKQKRGPAEPVKMDKLEDISTNENPDIKYYSGTILYNNTFNLADKPADDRVFINLNNLSAMAKVKVNGKYAGGVWTAPYRVDITDFVNKGENAVEIELVTTWANRLIGDLNLPEDLRKTWIPAQPWKAESQLFKSGLLGPVVVESIKR
ncbi:glycosyl hydrolase [Prevotella sp. 10(H)]|uniref:glycosyl hydrolase n=1 Tax=Prevotella sp. 10(H) TaxID=1158294 RepID=UPI0004A7789F|nr:glycosyl hydrolase [Prevotella sp. 10(H)]